MRYMLIPFWSRRGYPGTAGLGPLIP